MKINQSISLFLLAVFLCLYTACDKTKTTTSVENLYLWSHNDYEQPLPLDSALDLGFQMVEADIHLIDGQLYVIHDHPDNPGQTPLLEELYLAPLVERIEQNNGEVLPGNPLFFYLVIDVKTEAESTFKALINTLEPYKEIFFRKEDGEWVEGPVRLLISGNRPSLETEAPDRLAFLDGRLQNIGMGFSSDLYPIISDNWFSHFSWDGTGEIPGDELQKLRGYVRKAHNEDKIIRFWATPDREEVWRVLLDNGVDVINVDDLQGMRTFLDQEYYEE